MLLGIVYSFMTYLDTLRLLQAYTCTGALGFKQTNMEENYAPRTKKFNDDENICEVEDKDRKKVI